MSETKRGPGRPPNRPDLGITRARVDRATACHFAESNRIVIVADRGDFDAAQAALDGLRAKAERAGLTP